MKTLVRAVATICTFAICGLPTLGLGQSGPEPVSPPAPESPGGKNPVPVDTPLIPLSPSTPQTPLGGKAPRGIPPQIRLPGEETRIRADSLTEDTARKLVVGEGFVDVQYLGNRLQADRVQINFESGQGVAEGNVIFQDKGNRIVCDRIEFNVRRQQAILYGARGELGREYKISGERLERQDVNRYRVQGGSISTCQGPVPEWQFRSGSMDVTLEEFAFIRHPTFWVLGFPIGYLPFLIVPLKAKRSTGFLVPSIGNSERDGFRYNQQFFWAFSDYADATFGMEIRTERGLVPSAEVRYRLSSTTSGRADFKFLDDKLTGETFWRVRAEHRQEFGEKFEGFYTVERVNNGNFDSDFEDELGIRTRRDVESKVNLQKNWDSASFQVFAQFVDSAEEVRKDFLHRAPDVNFKLSPSVRKVGPVTISPSIQSSLVRFDRRAGTQEDNQWRIDMVPKLSVPLSDIQWLTFSPFMQARATWYTDGREPADRSIKTDSFFRTLWSGGLDVEGPKLFRTYPLKFEKFPAAKHLTQLNINHFYRPDIDADDRAKIVQFDDTDRLEPRHTLSYNWENRLLAKVPIGRESFESREVVLTTLSHSLDIRKLDEGEERPLGDVALRIESKPFRLWKIGFNTAYNIYDEEFSSYSVSLDIREGREWFVQHETRFAERKEGEFDKFTNVFSAGLRILKVFFIEGGARWTGEDMGPSEKNIIFRYRGCCWGLTLEYLDREDDTSFQIGFSLVGLLGGEGAPTFKFGRSGSDG